MAIRENDDEDTNECCESSRVKECMALACAVCVDINGRERGHTK